MHQTFKTYWYHRIWGRMKSWQNQAAWFSGKTEPPAGSRWRSLGRTRRCQEIPSHSILLHPVPVRGVAKPNTVISKRIQQWILTHGSNDEVTRKCFEHWWGSKYQHFRLQHAPRCQLIIGGSTQKNKSGARPCPTKGTRSLTNNEDAEHDHNLAGH
jgi:hypothetical protein